MSEIQKIWHEFKNDGTLVVEKNKIYMVEVYAHLKSSVDFWFTTFLVLLLLLGWPSSDFLAPYRKQNN